MSKFLTDYSEARSAAQAQANDLRRPMGLAATREFGRSGYVVFMVPSDPTKRFGRDATCEIVEPCQPQTQRFVYTTKGAVNCEACGNVIHGETIEMRTSTGSVYYHGSCEPLGKTKHLRTTSSAVRGSLAALLLILAACGEERPAAPAAAPQDTTSELAQPHEGRMHYTVMVLDSARAGLLSEVGDTVHVVARGRLSQSIQLGDVVRRCNRQAVSWCIDHKATDAHRVRGY